MNSHVSDPLLAPNRRIPKQKRSQIKVEQILDGALDLLAMIPFEDVTVRAITQHTGVTPPTFYAYFSDREAVLTALGMRYVEESIAVIDRLDETNFETWEDASDAMVDSYVEWLRSHAGFRVLWSSGHLDSSVIVAEKIGNEAIAQRIRAITDRAAGRQVNVPNHVFLFNVELTDRLLRYGFEIEENGDDSIFSEIKRALRAYMSTYI